MEKRIIYFDNAATSYPKPGEVIQAMVQFLREVGASPGRSAHRLSLAASRIIYEAREKVARLFEIKNSSRVLFGPNATEAINQGLYGLLRPGDQVLTSSLEHNSVMRPLRDLAKKGVEVKIIPCSPEGFLDPHDLKESWLPKTRMVVLNHASNVVGTLQPLEEIGNICRERGALFLVDAAQSAGAFPINMEKEKIDLLAFTGHKALCGPSGTGGLIVGERIKEKEFIPLKRGGTGSRSEFEEQPDFFPDLGESGTPNTVGLAGLSAGLDFVLREGVLKIRAHEMKLTQKLLTGLQAIPGVTVYGPQNPQRQLATLSFNIQGWSPAEVGEQLDEKYGILCRVGLHCSPATHRTIGTFPQGTVRFGLSYFNQEEEIEIALAAIEELSKERSRAR